MGLRDGGCSSLRLLHIYEYSVDGREDCRLCRYASVAYDHTFFSFLPMFTFKQLFPTYHRPRRSTFEMIFSRQTRSDQTHIKTAKRGEKKKKKKKKEYAPEILKILHDELTKKKKTTTNAHVYSFFLVVHVLLLVGNLPSLDDD